MVRLALLIIGFFTLFSSRTVYGAASTWPAPISLFHKSPYFNAWIDASSNLSTSPATRWPFFFNRFKNVGWFMGIRVDGTSYTIQGNGSNVNYTGIGVTLSTSITPTQTRFTIAVGPVTVNITYLTPIELQDWRLHSFPFTYTVFDVASSDGSPHEVQLYSDTSIQFVSSDDSNYVSWNTSLTTKSIIHMAQQRTLRNLVENNDMSEDGSQIFAYTATPNVSMTWQSTVRETGRVNFDKNGKLDNTSDTNFRTIAQWPVLAFALDLGNITQTTNPLVFGIGLIRDPVVSYRTAETPQYLSHLWQSKWNSIGSAVDDFLTSYPSASSRATAFDNLIQANATKLASQLNMTSTAATKFVDLHILNLRQTVGSLEFTTSKRGQPLAMGDLRVFMKDVGYSRRISPVEVLYASFPAFLFINTTLAGKLLEPLLEFQATSLYGNAYAAPDLGNSWPDIQGNTTNQSSLAIDSCGAMLIMTLAQARKSGDGALIFKYYNLLRKWADFLVQSTKQPGNYMSSDLLSGSNANLELKGIMGLYAMGKINSILEPSGADASKTSYYLDTANTRVQDWLNRAISSDHIVSSYGANTTWAMIYNLFAPRLLGANIIPEQVYETQASWYANRSATATRFGLQFDSTQSLAKAHWSLLSASSVFNASSSTGRDALFGMVHSRTTWQAGVTPNPASYSPIDGNVTRGSASPAMGAIYSILALSLPDLGINLPPGKVPSLPDSSSHSKAPVIVGAIFGTLAGILLIVGIIYILRRRRILESKRVIAPPEEVNPTPFTNGASPLTSEQINSPYVITPTKMSRTFNSEKISALLSRGLNNRTESATGSSVTGGSSLVTPSDDANLRQEVEQLRRVVETLSAQQPHPYQDSMPDEPPPMYPSNH